MGGGHKPLNLCLLLAYRMGKRTNGPDLVNARLIEYLEAQGVISY
jgi:hypothetical protein